MIKCTKCDATKDVDRLPNGWKRLHEDVRCQKCWRAKYALRAVTIPIVSPVGIGWQELRAALRESFMWTTQASNWALRQLAAHDVGLDADGKLPKMVEPRPDGKSLYKAVADRWSIDTRTAACIVRAATSKYRACRLAAHRGRVSIPSMRYPQPIPIKGETWSITEGEGGGLVLDFPLGRRERVQVRLKGGPNYRRQLLGVRSIMRGDAVQGEMAIMEQGTQVLVKMVAWFPRREPQAGGWAAALHTGGDAFVTLYNDDRRTIYRWNADHVRRWVMAQDTQMQRLREDLKAERRLGRERDGVLARMQLLRVLHHDRMHSFCHEVSAQVIGHLARRRCGMLMVVDQDKSYLPHFPWHKFRSMLTDKANRAGIEIASGDAASESPELLEVETQQ